MAEQYSYSLELKKQLGEDTWLRHLFNKLGKEVTVVLETGAHITGVLNTIEYIRGVLNLEVISADKSYFINWRNVAVVEAEKPKFEGD